MLSTGDMDVQFTSTTRDVTGRTVTVGMGLRDTELHENICAENEKTASGTRWH
jgi:hypothetical protein